MILLEGRTEVLKITCAMCIQSQAPWCPFNFPDASHHDGEDPIAQSKLDNGDGNWKYVKQILGWIIDGENYTIQFLQLEKCQKIMVLIKTIVKSHRCHLKSSKSSQGNYSMHHTASQEEQIFFTY